MKRLHFACRWRCNHGKHNGRPCSPHHVPPLLSLPTPPWHTRCLSFDTAPHRSGNNASDNQDAISPFPSPSSFPPAPLNLSTFEVVTLMQHHNQQQRYQQTRDLFHRYWTARSLRLTEDVCDATLHALAELDAPETMRVFALMLRRNVARSPRLYNRILQLLCNRSGQQQQQPDSVTDSAAHVLQLMQTHGIAPDVQTLYHLTALNLQHNQLSSAYTHYLALSSRMKPPTSTLTAAQFSALFRLFFGHQHLPGCEMVAEDMRRSGMRTKAWMQQHIDKLQQRQRRSAQHAPRKRREKQWWVDDEVTPAPPQSLSTFRVGLEHQTTPPLHPDVVRSIDDVDPLPPSIADTLGPLMADLEQLLHHRVDDDLDDEESAGSYGMERVMVNVLSECYQQGDVVRVLQFWSAPGTVTLSPVLLNLMLCTLSTANLELRPASASFSDGAGLLHSQLRDALAILARLEHIKGELLAPTAALLLRAFAYLPMPLPPETAAMGSSSSSSPSSLSLSSFSSPSFSLLPAELVAQTALQLHQHFTKLLAASPTQSPLSTLSTLQAFSIRAQCKHPLSGSRLLLSLPALASSQPALTPDCYAYLIYHQVHLPVLSLQAVYHVFSQLLASSPSTAPPALSLYFLLCGELLRGRHSKARAIYREAALRYGQVPSAYMTDALILAHRVVREQTNKDEARRQLEDEQDRLLDDLTTVAAWLSSSTAPRGLELGDSAMDAWWEMRRRRRVAERREDAGTAKRVEEDTAVAEVLWLGWQQRLQSSPSFSPPLPALCHLAVFMSSSPQLPSLLSTLQSLLSSSPYAHAYASDSALTAAIEVEQQLYAVSCRLSCSPQTLPSSSPSVVKHQFDAVTRFSFALSTLPPHSHAAFLCTHLLSRVVRCAVYSFVYSTPQVATLEALMTLVSSQQLDLDPYCCHVLLLHSVVQAHASAVLWYDRGVAAHRAVLALRQSPGLDGDSTNVVWDIGLGPGADSPFAYTTQHLQLCRLLYEASRPAQDRDIALEQQLLSALLPSMSAPDGATGRFLEDDVVLALIDYAIWQQSPAVLRAALAAVVLDGVANTPARARSYSTLTRGIIYAARGMRLRGWTDEVEHISAAWLSAFRYCFQHHAKEARLKLGPPPVVADVDSPFLRTQSELLHVIGAVAVEAQDASVLWPLYQAIVDRSRPALSPLRLLLHLPAFVIPLKACLLTAKASDKAGHIIADMERWYDSTRHWQYSAGSKADTDEDEAVKAVLKLCPFGKAIAYHITLDAIVLRYTRRIKLVKGAATGDTHRDNSQTEEDEPIVQDDDVLAVDRSAALRSYHELMSAHPAPLEPATLSAVSELLLGLSSRDQADELCDAFVLTAVRTVRQQLLARR